MTIMSPTLDDELLILWRKNSNLGFVSDYFGVRSLCKSSGDKVNPSEAIAPEYGSKMDTNGPTKVILFSV